MAIKNPIADYKARRDLTVTELAAELGISKGHASDLVNGKERVGTRVAQRMSELTGKPWYSFVAPPGAAA